MKSICFFLWLFLFLFYNPFISVAQEWDEEESAYFAQMNTLFQGVNLNLVPSGILSDYGFSFINLDNFTGQALHDSNRVDLQRWRFLYGALETF